MSRFPNGTCVPIGRDLLFKPFEGDALAEFAKEQGTVFHIFVLHLLYDVRIRIPDDLQPKKGIES